jgi:hypothetical protein
MPGVSYVGCWEATGSSWNRCTKSSGHSLQSGSCLSYYPALRSDHVRYNTRVVECCLASAPEALGGGSRWGLRAIAMCISRRVCRSYTIYNQRLRATFSCMFMGLFCEDTAGSNNKPSIATAASSRAFFRQWRVARAVIHGGVELGVVFFIYAVGG